MTWTLKLFCGSSPAFQTFSAVFYNLQWQYHVSSSPSSHCTLHSSKALIISFCSAFAPGLVLCKSLPLCKIVGRSRWKWPGKLRFRWIFWAWTWHLQSDGKFSSIIQGESWKAVALLLEVRWWLISQKGRIQVS